MKNILAIALFLVVVTGALLIVLPGARLPEVADLPAERVSVGQTRELCFASFGATTPSGFQDIDILRLQLDGSNAHGELKFLPAEKDSKVGDFTGTVTPVDPMSMSRTVHAWWDTHAEGMNTTEELLIVFGEGTASIAMGAMKDRGDGVYVYDTSTQPFYDRSLTDIGCDELTEREHVSLYLREHIGELSKEQPTLGGTWYVTTYSLDTSTNTGVVTYEDGHIQKTSNFSYTTDSDLDVMELVFHTTR